MTNIIPGNRLLSNRNGKVVLDYDEVALPYDMVEEKKILEPIGNKPRANEPGVTTLCITKDGYIYIYICGDKIRRHKVVEGLLFRVVVDLSIGMIVRNL